MLTLVLGAQRQCEVARPDYYERLNAVDSHAPKFARILGPAANSKDFKEAFGCPIKEPVCQIF